MRLTIAASVTLAAITIAGCGGGTIHAHGKVDVFASPLNGQSVQEAYPDIIAGARVTVTDRSGDVIGTGSLTYDAATEKAAIRQAASALPGTPAFMYRTWVEAFVFTVTVPGGERRYGIEVGHDRGTAWFTQTEMRKGPVLTLGSTG
jgi:hypothetical protein